jgi:hypothetical protein
MVAVIALRSSLSIGWESPLPLPNLDNLVLMKAQLVIVGALLLRPAAS